MRAAGEKRLTVRKFRADDIESLACLLSDETVMEYLEAPYTREKTAEFLRCAALCETPLIYAAEDKDGEFVGYIIYHKYDEAAFEIGWVLRKSMWGKGYAGELTERMIEYSVGKTEGLVIEFVPENTASKRIAEKYGFEHCGAENGLEVYRLRLK